MEKSSRSREEKSHCVESDPFDVHAGILTAVEIFLSTGNRSNIVAQRYAPALFRVASYFLPMSSCRLPRTVLQQQGCLHLVQYCSPFSCAVPLMHLAPQQSDRMKARCFWVTFRRASTDWCFSQYCLPFVSLPQPFTVQNSYFLGMREIGTNLQSCEATIGFLGQFS